MDAVLHALLLAGAVILAISGIGALVLYFLWYYERSNDDSGIALPGGSAQLRPLPALLGMVLEALAFAVLVATYPLRLLHDVLPHHTRRAGETPILLVHGWGANSACFLFIQLMLKLRGHHNVFGISYTPPIIRLEKLGPQVARHIEAALKATGAQKVNIVAHSMGGILSRYAIRDLGMDGKVDKVITLGSPHMGSKLAGILPGSGNVPQVRWQSAFLRHLADTGLTPGSAHYYSIYSEFDNFVLPARSAVMSGNAQNIHVPYHGHCALLYSPVVIDLIERCLAAAPGEVVTAN